MLQYKNIEEIILSFDPKIKKSLKEVPLQEQEDLEQELKAKIVEKVQEIKLDEPKSFWELVNKKFD